MTYRDEEYHKNYYINNINKIKKYRIENKDKIRKYMKDYLKSYYIENKERIKKQHRKYYEKNLKKTLVDCKIYRMNNDEQIKKAYKRWREANPEKVRIANNKWKKERRKIDLKYNLTKKISETIRMSLKGNKNGRHWEALVEYTLNDLIKRLKRTMPKGYAWQDYLDGKLHIDHKIPISAFNFDKSNQIDFRRCWALSNLQLLPAKENLEKYNKLTKPFQPTLKLLIKED